MLHIELLGKMSVELSAYLMFYTNICLKMYKKLSKNFDMCGFAKIFCLHL